MTILQLDSASDVTPENMKKLRLLISNKNTVLLNHATWCGHCQMFKPEWEHFKTSVGKNVNVVQIENDALSVLKQDKQVYKRVTPKDGMVYFPMIIIFVKKNNGTTAEKKIYEGSRTAEDLKEFINGKIKPAKETKKKSTKAAASKKELKPKAKSTKGTKSQIKSQSKLESDGRPSFQVPVPLTLQKLNDELHSILNQLNNL